MWGRGSVDDGEQWVAATLESPHTSSAWVFWNCEWAVQVPSRYALVVRATDGSGKFHASIEQDPAPDSEIGRHEISVTVA